MTMRNSSHNKVNSLTQPSIDNNGFVGQNIHFLSDYSRPGNTETVIARADMIRELVWCKVGTLSHNLFSNEEITDFIHFIPTFQLLFMLVFFTLCLEYVNK